MKSISLLSGYIFLTLAILSGIFSNSFLKATEGFSKLGPTLFCIANMFVCIFCLSKAMSVIPVGFTYATYGALTITAVTLFGVFKYNQIKFGLDFSSHTLMLDKYSLLDSTLTDQVYTPFVPDKESP